MYTSLNRDTIESKWFCVSSSALYQYVLNSEKPLETRRIVLLGYG